MRGERAPGRFSLNRLGGSSFVFAARQPYSKRVRYASSGGTTMIRCALVVAVGLAWGVAPVSAETHKETAEPLAALPAELSKNKNTIQEMAQAVFGAALKRVPNNTEMEVALKHIVTAKNREE